MAATRVPVSPVRTAVWQLQAVDYNGEELWLDAATSKIYANEGDEEAPFPVLWGIQKGRTLVAQAPRQLLHSDAGLGPEIEELVSGGGSGGILQQAFSAAVVEQDERSLQPSQSGRLQVCCRRSCSWPVVQEMHAYRTEY